jgi:phosphate-selective porin OprO/OprP
MVESSGLGSLEQRVRILERLLELEKEAASSRVADQHFHIKLRGYVHEDARYFEGNGHAGVNSFVLRRVRPIIEASAFRKYALRLMPDFGGSNVVLQDAYIDMTFARPFNLRFGKFKPPVGLERLMSATSLPFIERAFPTALVPNRDVGVQLSGDVLGGAVTYAVGAFNGVDDGGSSDADANDDKEIAVRVFVRPFASTTRWLRDFGVGISATHGEQHGSLTTPGVAGYRSPGQNSFFSYRSNGQAAGTVIADGNRSRLVPQGSLYLRGMSMIAEHVTARHEVRLNTQLIEIENRAWQVSAGYVLTGEDAGERGVKPLHAFDPADRTWGALELTARVHALLIDDDAFPLLADLTRSAKEARAWGVGVNWYLNPNVKLVVNYDRTTFSGGAVADVDRPLESALFSRIQFAL